MGVKHTHYAIPIVPPFTLTHYFWIIPISILFGLAAMLFSRSTIIGGFIFENNTISPLRPLWRNSICICHVFHRYDKILGLGVPIIIESFLIQVNIMTFTSKYCLLDLLGAGFKGGEVTPVFIGHIREVPYPFCSITYCALGMGFVRFSELPYAIACTLWEWNSWNRKWTIYRTCLFYSLFGIGTSIYHSQIVKGPKHLLYQKFKREIRQLLILKQR
jgi:hypothetical protein